jgi:hypothetical protein
VHDLHKPGRPAAVRGTSKADRNPSFGASCHQNTPARQSPAEQEIQLFPEIPVKTQVRISADFAIITLNKLLNPGKLQPQI